MTLVGCYLHSRNQQVAVLDTDTGEVQERRLAHDDHAVEQFASKASTSLAAPSSGDPSLWGCPHAGPSVRSDYV